MRLALIGFIVRLIFYTLFGLIYLPLLITAATQGAPVLLLYLFVFLLISVPVSVLELRYASHKKRTSLLPVTYYLLQNDPGRQNLVLALNDAICSDGAWRSETERQADISRFWQNISTGEHIFLLITPFYPLIIALGHMGRRGSHRARTKSVRATLTRAESAAFALTAGKIPDNQVIEQLEMSQMRHVQSVTISNEIERLTQSMSIKSCPKCGRWVCDKAIECPFCLYHFELNDDLQQQKRTEAIEQQIAFISGSGGSYIGRQLPMKR